MLSPFARSECLAVSATFSCLAIASYFYGVWWLAPVWLVLGLLILAFYRNPTRHPPVDRNVLVSPADGKVVSIHEVPHFPPIGGPAVCIRIFLSVFDVHVNYSPCHATAGPQFYRAGQHMSVLRPESAEVNEAITTILLHPVTGQPVVAVRQIAGQFARTVYSALSEGQIIQRGMPFGIMKLGSTAEIYVPLDSSPEIMVRVGQRVTGATTILVRLPARHHSERSADVHATQTESPAVAHETPAALPVADTVPVPVETAVAEPPAPAPEASPPTEALAPTVEDTRAAPNTEEPAALGVFSSSLLADPPQTTPISIAGDPPTLLDSSPLTTSGIIAIEQAAATANVPIALPPEDQTATPAPVTPDASDTLNALDSNPVDAFEQGAVADGHETDDAEDTRDITEHAIGKIMSADGEEAANTLPQDGDHLASRMEIAGTDLMLHPKDEGSHENDALAGALMGLRPDATATTDLGDPTVDTDTGTGLIEAGVNLNAKHPPTADDPLMPVTPATSAFMAWHEAQTAKSEPEAASPSVPQVEPLTVAKRRPKSDKMDRTDKKTNPDALLWEEAE